MAHLKRFGYDWKQNNRYKLHHNVSFPLYINLDLFLEQNIDSNKVDAKRLSQIGKF